MIKHKIILILLLVATYSYGQKLHISYNVKALKLSVTDRPDTLPKPVQEMFRKAKQDFKNIEYTLLINDSVSLFFMNEQMINDANQQMKIAIALAGFDGQVYSDREKNLNLRKTNTYGQEFLIHSLFDEIEWTLTKEKKEINGYVSYKALGKEMIISKGEDKVRTVTAWYSPSISLPFGPLGYGNLPGLILELSVAGKTYHIKEIKKTLSNQKEVVPPTEGKVVSKKEFEKIGKKIYSRTFGD